MYKGIKIGRPFHNIDEHEIVIDVMENKIYINKIVTNDNYVRKIDRNFKNESNVRITKKEALELLLTIDIKYIYPNQDYTLYIENNEFIMIEKMPVGEGKKRLLEYQEGDKNNG